MKEEPCPDCGGTNRCVIYENEPGVGIKRWYIHCPSCSNAIELFEAVEGQKYHWIEGEERGDVILDRSVD